MIPLISACWKKPLFFNLVKISCVYILTVILYLNIEHRVAESEKKKVWNSKTNFTISEMAMSWHNKKKQYYYASVFFVGQQLVFYG